MPHKFISIQCCITAFVEKERVTDDIFLYLFSAFDTVVHNVLAYKMRRNGFDGWMTWLKTNELDYFIYRVCVQHMQSWSIMVSSPVSRGLGKARYSLTNLIFFHNNLTCLVDEGKAVWMFFTWTLLVKPLTLF